MCFQSLENRAPATTTAFIVLHHICAPAQAANIDYFDFLALPHASRWPSALTSYTAAASQQSPAHPNSQFFTDAMPKKAAKQKKKERKQHTELKPPSLLAPSSPAKPTASTSNREIIGLPKTPRNEIGNVLDRFTTATTAGPSSSGLAQPMTIAIEPKT